MANQGTNLLSSRAIIGRYFATLEQMQMASWVGQTSVEFMSNQDSETYRFLGMTPAMREWIGSRQAKNLLVNGITIDNKHYEATLDIPVADIRRDKTSQIMVRVDELAARNVNHWNKLLSALIAAGAATVGYDGKFFFATDHAEGDSGTQINALAAAQVAELNVGSATAPTADEMASAILGVIAYMHSYVDDQGEPMNEDSKSFTVMCGTPAIFSAAMQAVSKNSLNTGTGVRDNPLVGGGLTVNAVYNQRLSATTNGFYTFRTDAPMKPLIRQVETQGVLKAIAEGSELEFNNDIWRFGVDSWRNVGYGYWQYAALATLS